MGSTTNQCVGQQVILTSWIQKIRLTRSHCRGNMSPSTDIVRTGRRDYRQPSNVNALCPPCECFLVANRSQLHGRTICGPKFCACCKPDRWSRRSDSRRHFLVPVQNAMLFQYPHQVIKRYGFSFAPRAFHGRRFEYGVVDRLFGRFRCRRKKRRNCLVSYLDTHNSLHQLNRFHAVSLRVFMGVLIALDYGCPYYNLESVVFP